HFLLSSPGTTALLIQILVGKIGVRVSTARGGSSNAENGCSSFEYVFELAARSAGRLGRRQRLWRGTEDSGVLQHGSRPTTGCHSGRICDCKTETIDGRCENQSQSVCRLPQLDRHLARRCAGEDHASHVSRDCSRGKSVGG